MQSDSETSMSTTISRTDAVSEKSSLTAIVSSSESINMSSIEQEIGTSVNAGTDIAYPAVVLGAIEADAAAALNNKMSGMQLKEDIGAIGESELMDKVIGAKLLESNTKDIQQLESSASMSSLASSMTSVKKRSTSMMVAELTSPAKQNGNEPTVEAAVTIQATTVKIEDCPNSNEVETATLVVKIPAKAGESRQDETETEVVEVIEEEEEESDGAGEITETVKVIEKTVPTANGGTETTITTVKVVKKHSVDAGDGTKSTGSVSASSSRRSSNTASTTVTTAPAAGSDKIEAVNVPETTAKRVVVKQPSAEAEQEQKEVEVAEPKQQEIVAKSDEEFEEEEEEVEEEELVEEEEEEEEKVEVEPETKAKAEVQPKSIVADASSEALATELPTPATAPAAVSQPIASIPARTEKVPQLEPQHQDKQSNLNNSIKEIISDIDSNIQEQESVALLKQQQQQLLLRQQELAEQVRQQQLLAQKLAAENRAHQQLLQQRQQLEQQQKATYTPTPSPALPQLHAPQQNISKVSNIEETQDEHGFTRKVSSYETQESSNVSKHIDLHKILTPATDAPEILPKNRKLYASSAFYAPGLHPTVEDQVELARRISHSLSDVSNHKSKGQSMYVNRKKRSVKWVHEGSRQDAQDIQNCEDEYKENTETTTAETNGCATTNTNQRIPLDKVPLRLLMNPRGQMHDINTMRDTLNTDSGLLSPNKCAELVTALQTQKGKGAELFAKRRKKAENWVVNENNVGTQNPSGLPDFPSPHPKPPTSPSILPAYSDAGKHRVQLNMHQEQLLEKYAKPGLKVVKTPWEAALETGSASAAFVEENKLAPLYTPSPTLSPAPAPKYHDIKRVDPPYSRPSTIPDYGTAPEHNLPQPQFTTSKPAVVCGNVQRDLAYKPNIPQGWRAPGVLLPKAAQCHQLSANILETDCCAKENADDEEIMSYIRGATDTTLTTQSQSKLQSAETVSVANKEENSSLVPSPDSGVHVTKKTHELLDLLGRSPEWCVSPIPLHNLLAYDNAVQELQTTYAERCIEIVRGEEDSHRRPYETVDVRKQLQQLEQFQKQLKAQQQQEEMLLQQRNLRQRQQQRKQPQQHPLGSAPQIQDLYVPKEIPLESYAPPPVVNMKASSVSPYTGAGAFEQHSWKPTSSPVPPSDYFGGVNNQYNSNMPYGVAKPLNTTPTLSAPASSFPLSKSNTSGFSSYGSAPPPKQQYWAPKSYQKVPQQTNPAVPQVNFNPSPLPYDKLAKFENSAEQDQQQAYSYSPQPRRLTVKSQGSKVRNLSPTPYRSSTGGSYSPLLGSGGSSANRTPVSCSSRPPSQYDSDVYNNASTPNPTSVRFSANYILHGQNYNKTARGWPADKISFDYGGAPPACGATYGMRQSKPPMPVTTGGGSLPYTDF